MSKHTTKLLVAIILASAVGTGALAYGPTNQQSGCSGSNNPASQTQTARPGSGCGSNGMMGRMFPRNENYRPSGCNGSAMTSPWASPLSGCDKGDCNKGCDEGGCDKGCDKNLMSVTSAHKGNDAKDNQSCKQDKDSKKELKKDIKDVRKDAKKEIKDLRDAWKDGNKCDKKDCNRDDCGKKDSRCDKNDSHRNDSNRNGSRRDDRNTPSHEHGNTTTPSDDTHGDRTCQTGSFNDQFLCLINAHRKANGKIPLAYDNALNKAAENHSKWMSQNNTLSHTGNNSSQFYQRCQAEGTSCDAENIAYGFRSAQDLFNMWKNSPGHNANMLGDHTKMGLGISGKYATNDFK